MTGSGGKMKIRTHFYAQLREVAGTSWAEVDLNEDATIADLLDRLYAKFPGLRAHDKTILFGAGVEFVKRGYKLKPDEEIAVMPPVQGG